jgi:hypothetical protein
LKFIKTTLILLFCCVMSGCNYVSEDAIPIGEFAQLRITLNTSQSAYTCLLQQHEGRIVVKAYSPTRNLVYEEEHQMATYSDVAGAFELDITLEEVVEIGEWTIEYWDTAGNQMDTNKRPISQFDIEKENTIRAYVFITEEKAGC